jgi:glycine/D-amino acid oxidase-like deaminating enzyme
LQSTYDAIIIGGGFYGCSLALALARRLPRILILEREPDLLTRASYVNQARVHNGYHYPRSLVTAMRSAANYQTFLNEYEDCVDRTFLHLYAVARGTSKVSAYQFRKFCERVNIPLSAPPASLAKLFNPALIEEVFVAEESAFDAARVRDRIATRLRNRKIETSCGAEVTRVAKDAPNGVRVFLSNGDEIRAPYVFNCAYSQINEMLSRSSLPKIPLKYELAELALIEMPPPLEKVAVTVMDGPFFSAFPFPSLGLHTLSHVTYTPHDAWTDQEGSAPRGSVMNRPTKAPFMLKDAQRYLPILKEAKYVRSLFETKTVLLKNEMDDGRPILCAEQPAIDGFFSILGAKIDNIYDVIQILESEQFGRSTQYAACG